MPHGTVNQCQHRTSATHIAATDGSQIQVFDIRTQRWTFSERGKGLGQIERMMSSRQIPQSDLSRYLITCLGPDDAPVAAVTRNNAEIYALELELP